MAQTLALGQRDSDNATAQSIAAMTISPHPQSGPSKSKPSNVQQQPQSDENDEIARAQATARMKAFMGYRGDEDDDLLDDQWEVDAEGEGEYDGEGGRMVVEPPGRGVSRREKGTGEEVDEFGEDEEAWAEGNDEYLEDVRAGT